MPEMTSSSRGPLAERSTYTIECGENPVLSCARATPLSGKNWELISTTLNFSEDHTCLHNRVVIRHGQDVLQLDLLLSTMSVFEQLARLDEDAHGQ